MFTISTAVLQPALKHTLQIEHVIVYGYQLQHTQTYSDDIANQLDPSNKILVYFAKLLLFYSMTMFVRTIVLASQQLAASTELASNQYMRGTNQPTYSDVTLYAAPFFCGYHKANNILIF